jgi:hypothetical protein
MANFARALDESLAAMARGASLDDCLEQFPRHADELRTHLLLAQRIGRTPPHAPRPGAQAAAWQQFRAKAEDVRLGRRPPINLNLSWARPLAITAALALAVFGGAGGTVIAAQDAAPDSQLYRVKLASEDVRVWFTFDEASRAELLLDQSNTRTEEMMGMVQDGKDIPGSVLQAMRHRNARAVRILEDKPDELALLTRAREQSAEQEQLLLALWGDVGEGGKNDYAETVATLHNAQLRTTDTPGSIRPEEIAAGVIRIAGAVEPVDDGLYLLGGVEVRLDARAQGETDLEAGQTASVIAARDAEGHLLALSVAVTDDTTPEQRYFVSGALEDFDDDEVVIGGQRIALTQKTLLRLRLQRGQQVEIEVEDVGGQATASSVDDTEGTDRPLLAYEGIIEDEVSTNGVNNDWVVGGQPFTVTPDTEIDARSGVLASGSRARVEAVASDGEAIARRVVILPEDAADETIRVEGVLEEEDEGTWTVSGVEVAAPANAESPEVGSMVSVEGQREEKKLVARRLLATYNPGSRSLATLRGRIGRVDEGGAWQVGLVSVLVEASTVVRGQPEVGRSVFVWGSRDEEGSLEAAYIAILDSRHSAD